jgi:hypothetical protein
MSDREMLELAAKAAEIKIYESTDGTIQNRPVWVFSAGGGMGTMPYEEQWNPLLDDGQALRLAVALRMNVVVKALPHAVYVEAYNGQAPAVMETLADVRGKDFDPLAATRRAIVRAAAEIGRQMP